MNDRDAPDSDASNPSPDDTSAADTQADLFGFVVPEPSAAKPDKAAAPRASRGKREGSPVDHANADEATPANTELAGFEAAQPSRPAPAPSKRRARGVLPMVADQATLDLAADLPPQVRLGTSSWSFPGWRGIVYGDDYSHAKLARDGLSAYGAHPLLRSVSIDRSFYAPLSVADYLRYAQQVPDPFRFIVKAPASITDACVRGDRGEPVAANPCFLNPQLAASDFVEPCLAGLGDKAGALVFQFPPLPDQLLADPAVFVERLYAFLMALPPLPAKPDGPCYAVEIRDAILLTPRFVRALRAAGVRYCVGLHARMPDPLRQAAALALMDGETPAGPLIVRWSLHSGFRYEQAKARYEPFDQLVDEDPHTREALAELAARYALAGQPVLIATNNKSEGSAPLSCAKLARAIADAFVRVKAEQEEEGGKNETPPEGGAEESQAAD